MFLEPLRVVFDTSVIVSSALIPQSVPHQAILFAQQQMRILFSETNLGELAEVLQRPKLRRFLDEEKVATLLHDITQGAELISATTRIRACRDPKDDKFLELAVSGEADYIITGDQDLLILNPFEGIKIITPREFIDEMQKTT